MSDTQNPPAFPAPMDADHDGMTLRDYFAGQALVGGLASGARIDGASATQREGLAVTVYAIADAMLAARKAPTP